MIPLLTKIDHRTAIFAACLTAATCMWVGIFLVFFALIVGQITFLAAAVSVLVMYIVGEIIMFGAYCARPDLMD